LLDSLLQEICVIALLCAVVDNDGWDSLY